MTPLLVDALVDEESVTPFSFDVFLVDEEAASFFSPDALTVEEDVTPLLAAVLGCDVEGVTAVEVVVEEEEDVAPSDAH